MTTYEDRYGDFGPIRMTPQELTDLYRRLDTQRDAYVPTQEDIDQANDGSDW